MENTYSPAWPHGNIQEVFPDIFFVMGTNITHYNNVELQHSRNMIIVRDNGKLSLINTVRLTDQGLSQLEALGTIANVIRIGSFHGRDDAFYLDKYNAKLWEIEGMTHQHHHKTDFYLKPNGPMPFAHCSVFIFNTTQNPEGALHINQHGGILITCDSIKNWIEPDEFFSEATAKMYQELGYFGKGKIMDVWLNACGVQLSDFERLNQTFKYKVVLGGHGR